MKKVLLFVVLVVLLTAGSVYAQGKGIQILGGTENNSGIDYYLDDVKIGKEYEIEGWGIIFIAKYETSDYYWDAESTGYRVLSSNTTEGADTVILKLDITNLSFKPQNYLDDVSVKVVYNDQWEINGYWWARTKSGLLDAKVLKSNEVKTIDPFYQGFYGFGVKVPDYILKDTKPLRMEIKLGDIELIYYIRK